MRGARRFLAHESRSKYTLFLRKWQGDSKKTVYMLYSLTNSLVDLGGIERVKFLLNNKEGTGVFEQYYNKNTDI